MLNKSGFEFWIAGRYLKVRNREFFISLITWISVGGIALGVGALIVIMAVMDGFESDLRSKILGANAHIRITAQKGELADYQEVMRKAGEIEGVKGASPYVDAQVMFMARGHVQGVELRGIDADTVNQVLDLEKYVGQFNLDDSAGRRPGVLVGIEMARNLGLQKGDEIKLVSPEPSMTPAGPIPRFKIYRVAGIFNTGMYEYDIGVVFARNEDARNFLRMDKGVSGVELRLADVYGSAKIAEKLKTSLGPDYQVRDWTEMNKSLFFAMKLEQLAMFTILGLIILVAAFNIASLLIMVVMEKSRDIGVMKSIGAGNRQIRRIFIIEGAILGVAGASLGVVMGVGLAFALKKYQFLKLPSDVYYINTLPVELNAGLIAAVFVCSIGLSVLAALYPSWQASRMDPIETIRYE